jgi:hypothetical protein
MSETGTSYSAEPISNGPGRSGNVGIGLREENMLRVNGVNDRVTVASNL